MRILSIDGGGIRGLVPARVLERLEAITGRPVFELFDLVAGTSTGGILGCSLCAPALDAGGGARHTAAELVGLYRTEGPRIFRRSLGQRVRSLEGLVDEKHSAAALDDALERYLGDARLGDALVALLVTTYDLQARAPFFFKSWRTDEEGRDALLRDVARATAAAPTYFEPLRWRSADGRGPQRALVDGGVFAANPAMCAYAEAARLRPGEPVLVLSLGTGETFEPIAFDDAKDWGLAEWARPVIDVVLDGVSDTVGYQLDHLVPEADRLRLQTTLPRSIGMDDASAEALDALDAAASTLLDREDAALRAFAARLTA
ncbi:patatin-like phospholipase family protein [Conexibacter sp. SYSU D00693]|uniref:patatin-like phospholipase family protein n=1 Tax=Conexibacter sp. SYSU D00693 TaxID=2812560 RepID=UPI00196A81C4|nr:patatin-like phospholipase family protein [Conexibacter sp. SYSU D00693]